MPDETAEEVENIEDEELAEDVLEPEELRRKIK